MDLTSAHCRVLLLLCISGVHFPPCWFQWYCQKRWLAHFHLTPTPLCRVAPHSYRRTLGFDDYLLERLVWLGKRFECAGMFIIQHRFIQLFCRAWNVLQVFLGLEREKLDIALVTMAISPVLPWPIILDMMPQAGTVMLHRVLSLMYSIQQFHIVLSCLFGVLLVFFL